MSAKLSTPLAKTWKRRLNRWQRSGLGAAAFSKQEKVSEPRLYVWRKRFDEARKARLAPARPVVPAFVPVQVRSTPCSGPMELVLKSGYVLRLPADVGPGHLAEILKAVGAC
jgi:hypothetical protein